MTASTIREVQVSAARLLCSDVRAIRLSAVDGRPLPGFQPGAHITLDTPAGGRSYSLTDDGFDSADYGIAVRRQGPGSDWVHHLSVGDHLQITEPRSNFGPTLIARRHLLIAGGIGITPILSHLRSAVRWGRDVQVVYGHSAGRAAYVDEVSRLAGDRAEIVTGRTALASAIHQALARQPIGTHMYACGPAALLDLVSAEAQAAGWPESRVHIEHFQAVELDPGEPFTARVASQAEAVRVPSGVSLLEALEDAGVRVPNMCRQGVCGECCTRLLGVYGEVEHRDLLQSAAEKARNESIYPCVSRGTRGSVIELDL